MRILSWNLNGIKSCLRRDDFKQIRELPPLDVICFQETRTQEKPIVWKEYFHCWYPAQEKRYSGTLTLSLVKPMSIKYGFGIPELDTEGRVITTEHGDIYVVNVYIPNSSKKMKREEYRREWDAAFREHLSKLSQEKPVIICGDFNATLSRQDIYEENTRMDFAEIGYASDERSALISILEDGYVDAFRYLYPSERGAWTWWSNRRNKRGDDRGWRLDYFFVDERIKDKIVDVHHHNEITGSDHCPIVLECVMDNPEYAKKYAEVMAENEAKQQEQTLFAEMWRKHKENFPAYREKLANLQENITINEGFHLYDEVKRLQIEILDDIRFRCLAVDKATLHPNTPVGTDGVKWRTDDEKMKAALTLSWRNYEASPKKIIDIKSKSGKVRPTGILTYRDRAMSILCEYTFTPIEEAHADRCSYAFRPGRSSRDAVTAIANLFSDRDAPEIFVYADIQGFYASLQHKWIMRNVPIVKDVLWAFLNAGHIVSGDLFPASSVGISEGSPLSPAVANYTLDGLQGAIYKALHGRTGDIDYANGAMVRYADDIVIAVRTTAEAAIVIEAVKDFLAPRGLALSEDKTRVGKIKDGIDVIGFTVKFEKQTVTIKPREASVQRFIDELYAYIKSFNKSQRELIEGLNKKLTGWAGHYRFCDAYDAYRRIDVAVDSALIDSVMEKNPHTHYAKLIDKYWYTDKKRVSWFCLPNDPSCRVIHLVDTTLIVVRRGRTDINPYFETDYLTQKKKKDEIENISARYRPIYEKQNGRCFYCKRPLTPDQHKMIVPISHKKKATLANSAYIHTMCQFTDYQYVTAYEDIDGLPEFDILKLLTQINETGTVIRDPALPDNWKYMPLYDYFGMTTRTRFTLTFEEIEKILGFPLTDAIKANRTAWYSRKDTHLMADAWTMQGFKLDHLYMGKQQAHFTALYEDAEVLKIPPELVDRKIPARAKRELEHFFEAIIRKYGLTTDEYYPEGHTGKNRKKEPEGE